MGSGTGPRQRPHELATYSARVRGSADALVFGSAAGRQQSPSNIRRRILTPAVDRANVALVKSGVEPMPGLTPHSLRRTFANLLFAIGKAPPYVMAQMGHTTAELTLAVYAPDGPPRWRAGAAARARERAEIGTATDSHGTILAFDDQRTEAA